MIRRRAFLFALLAAAAAFPRIGGGGDDPSRLVALLSLLPPDSRRLGEAALAAGHARTGARVEALFAGIPLGAGTRRQLGTRAGKAVRADFEAGRIVEIRGWQLAQTEVELCIAYAELVPPGPRLAVSS